MKSTKNWEELLRFIYEHDDNWEYYAKGRIGIDETHPFVTDTGLNVPGARSAFSFLNRHDLIEDQGEGFVQLTAKGFDVVREHESKANRNKSFVAFTAILAIIAILDITATELVPNIDGGKVILGGLLIVSLIAIYYLSAPYLD